ncbi:MAG: aminoacyl--tRNA ligase-related protein [Patescibacteria group bacterium]
MKLSQLFTKTERTAPKDEVAANSQLLTRGGFVYKNSAGIYSYLPLGWKVMQKISGIIREEMDAIGGQEMFMPALVEKKYLETTGRWDVSVGFEVKGKEEKAAGFVLGWTHEEVLTAIASRYVSSYNDLPFAAYQIQTKFRNEARAKSGLLRGKEFMMKDLYSFHASEEDLMKYYKKVAEAYGRIFKRCGLEVIYTLAAGGDFTMSHTHEFQVIAPAGEDTIFVCEKCGYAENKEVSKLMDGGKCEKCGGNIKEEKAIEVGNIFPLGTKYSEAFGLKFRDEKGVEKEVVMGSYGIGLGRVMATVCEIHHDDKGIIWPEAVAPFRVHLIELPGGKGDKIYEDLQQAGVEVLYDDREISAGEKFAEADLIGIPWRLVVSSKTSGKVEVKKRDAKVIKLVLPKQLLGLLKTLN